MLLHIYSVNMMKKVAFSRKWPPEKAAQWWFFICGTGKLILGDWLKENRFQGRANSWMNNGSRPVPGGHKHSWQPKPWTFNENPFKWCQLFDLDAFWLWSSESQLGWVIMWFSCRPQCGFVRLFVLECAPDLHVQESHFYNKKMKVHRNVKLFLQRNRGGF